MASADAVPAPAEGYVIVLARSARALAAALRAALPSLVGAACDEFTDRDLRALDWPCHRYDRFRTDAVLQAVDTLLEAPSAAGRHAVFLLGGGLEPLFPELLPALRRRGIVLGPSDTGLHLLTQPLRMASMLARHGVSTPERREGRAPADGEWLRKPCLGAGGVGVTLLPPGAAAGPGYYLERYHEGAVLSLAGFARGTLPPALLGAATQRPVAYGAARFTQEALLAHPDPARHGMAREEAQTVLAAVAAVTEHVGLFGIDLIRAQDGVLRVIDVNLRFPASLALLPSCGQALATLFALQDTAAPLDGAEDASAEDGERWRGSLVVHAVEAALWPAAPPTLPDGLVLADIPMVGERLEPTAPVCTVAAAAATADELAARLRAGARQVHAALAGAPR